MLGFHVTVFRFFYKIGQKIWIVKGKVYQTYETDRLIESLDIEARLLNL